MSPIRTFLSSIRAVAVVALSCSSLRAQSTNNPPTNNLALWVRADAGVTADASGAVSLWEAQSPNGIDAVQAEPTSMPVLVTNAINGKPVLRFDGVASPAHDFLDVASAPGLDITGDIATFAVV